MDLTFKKSEYTPSREFWGDLSKNRFEEIFGNSTRYIARLLFKTNDAPFEAIYKFVIDTGAFISYAPDMILKHLQINSEFTGYIRGAAPQKEN
ncbi:MAG: hypothetical protein R6U96_02395 [Promethearchaeia archaeon]